MIVRLDEPARPHVVEVEAQHVEQYSSLRPEFGTLRHLATIEQSLVLKGVDHLRDLGHKVTTFTVV